MEIRQKLFEETSHSPSLIDLVGAEEAKSIIDFCFIANPYYPTPAMMSELATALPRLIKSYPSSNPAESVGALAEVLGVERRNLILGNGATELIATLCETLVETLAVPVPTFSEYLEKLPRGSLALYQTPHERFQLVLADYLAWLRREQVHAALIINPGNPTGQTFSREELCVFLDAAGHLDIVLVDESFIDFAGEEVPTLLSVADRYSNLVIVRSMSKHCGVPGLRLGYCYTNNRYLLNRLRRLLPTWNVNTLAEHFIGMLPATDPEFHESRRRLMAERDALYEGLRTVPGLRPYPSGANFVLVGVDWGCTARELQLRLLRERRMYVRDCANKLGMDDRHVRIASQGAERDRLLLEALSELAEEYGAAEAAPGSSRAATTP